MAFSQLRHTWGWGLAVAAMVGTVAVTRAAAPAGRFTVDGGVVYDTKTQLHWLKTPKEGPFTWDGANQHCADLDEGGSTNWRVPSMKELHTIIDETSVDIRVDTSIFDIPSGEYIVWSSTTASNLTNMAHGMAFNYASPTPLLKTNKLPVICVY